MADVIPPEQLRLLFLRPRPNQAIDFDPEGTDAIPRLFDEWDRLAAAVSGREFRGELPADHARLFAMSLVDGEDVAAEAAAYRPAFAHLAFLLQLPDADLQAKVEAEKGALLTERERTILDERTKAARAWLDRYAPDRARVQVQDQLPDEVNALRPLQRSFLASLADRLSDPSSVTWSGDTLQSAVFETAYDRDLPTGEAFAALYAAFLGRPNGPRAGWLLASLEREFVVARLREASTAGTLTA
jgi:lysyl-tRNA synthetase class 1